MANDYTANPIVLDTFSTAIDVGNSLFSNSNAQLKVSFIEWQTPTTADHTAVIKDADDNEVFNETCVTAKQSIKKDFYGKWFKGMKIAVSGVGSGKIHIQLC